MGSLYLWGRSIQEMGGDVVIGCYIYGVVLIDGLLYSRFYSILQVTESWVGPGNEAISSLCNCFNFNVVCRVVKLSSPNLNILIIAGAILLYVSVFLYVFSVDDKEKALTQTILCNVRW